MRETATPRWPRPVGATKQQSPGLTRSLRKRRWRSRTRQTNPAREVTEARESDGSVFEPVVYCEGCERPFPVAKRALEELEGLVLLTQERVVGCYIERERSGIGVLRSPLCLSDISEQVGPLGLGVAGQAILAFDGGSDGRVSTKSQHGAAIRPWRLPAAPGAPKW